MTDTERIPIPVYGMTCQHCVKRVTEALEALPGVTHADVDLDAEQAVVTHSGTITRDDMAEAVAEAGYEVPAAA